MASCKNRTGDILVITDRFQDAWTVWLVTGHGFDKEIQCWYYNIRILHDIRLSNCNAHIDTDSQLIRRYYRRKSTKVFRIEDL